MTDIIIQPGKLKGNIHIPPSKSMAHRAIIAASLADGESIIDNIQLSDDIIASIDAMKALGAQITIQDQNDRKRLLIQGVTDFNKSSDRLIDANESGSTLRFMIPIASLFNGKNRFIGRGKLGSRPLDIYEDIYKEQGLYYESTGGDELDLVTEGQLTAGVYQLAGDVSSQFITGLLYTLPLLEGDSQIQISTALESVGYIDLTLEVLNDFGVHVNFDREKNTFDIPGNQDYQARTYKVEGDYSQAAFFLSAAALGNEVTVSGLDLKSKQGDKAIIDILMDLGANLKAEAAGLTMISNQLTATPVIDGAQVPDIIPITALVASLSQGKTAIIHLERLRIKESDRLEATRTELAKIGAKIQVVGDSLHIEGVDQLEGNAKVWSHKDHRMAMMLAIASTVSKEAIIIQDAECVSKSYPTFWEDFKSIGGQISEWNLGK